MLQLLTILTSHLSQLMLVLLLLLLRPEALVPLMKGARRLVLVGDHKQLPPVVQSEQAKAGGLQLSLFQRLMDMGAPKAMLQVKINMHSSGKYDSVSGC